MVCLADVEAKPVEWLWKPYVPLRMLTMLSGDPGIGKTALAMALAASLTRGETILSGEPATPGNVLYLTNENSPEYVLRPRFEALDGVASRFFWLRGTLNSDDKPRTITLEDTGQLEQAVTDCHARLVVIDPLQSFLGADVDAHRANETRPVLDGLIKLAERKGCAILINRHLSKGVGGSALYRPMGSIDITGAARCELLVASDPQDSTRRIVAQSKSNLGEFGPSLAFSIVKDGAVKWHGESGLKADELLAPPSRPEDRSRLEEAEEFLRLALSEGPKPTVEVQTQAKENGISHATLRRATKSLGVVKKPGGFEQPWTLELPRVAQDSAELLKDEF